LYRDLIGILYRGLILSRVLVQTIYTASCSKSHSQVRGPSLVQNRPSSSSWAAKPGDPL